MPRRPTLDPSTAPLAEPAATSAPLETDGPDASAIAHRAYELYEARGREPGRHEDDWLQAERELRQRRDADQAVAQVGGGAPPPTPPIDLE